MSYKSTRSSICAAAISALMMAGSASAAWAGWVAVAANGAGNWGFAVGQPDKATAERLAVQGCNLATCKVVGSAEAKCIAYWHFTGGGYWFGVGIGNSSDFVMDVAARGCGRPQRPCVPVGLRCA